MPELTQLESAKSMIRYLPANGTAGLARLTDSTDRRSPCPPARMTATTFTPTSSPAGRSRGPHWQHPRHARGGTEAPAQAHYGRRASRVLRGQVSGAGLLRLAGGKTVANENDAASGGVRVRRGISRRVAGAAGQARRKT